MTITMDFQSAGRQITRQGESANRQGGQKNEKKDLNF